MRDIRVATVQFQHAAGDRVYNLGRIRHFVTEAARARVEIGDAVLMGADIPGAEPMRSAYLTLRVDSAKEAERLYALLGEGGQIFMKMEQTFFANRFAMLRDRFGTSWMLLHEKE